MISSGAREKKKINVCKSIVQSHDRLLSDDSLESLQWKRFRGSAWHYALFCVESREKRIMGSVCDLRACFQCPRVLCAWRNCKQQRLEPLPVVTSKVIVYSCLEPVGRFHTFAQDTFGCRERYQSFEDVYYLHLAICIYEFMFSVICKCLEIVKKSPLRRLAKTAPRADFFFFLLWRNIVSYVPQNSWSIKSYWTIRD